MIKAGILALACATTLGLTASACSSSAQDAQPTQDTPATQDVTTDQPTVAIQRTNSSAGDFTIQAVDSSGGSWVNGMAPTQGEALDQDQSLRFALQGTAGTSAGAQLVLTGYGDPFPIELALDTDGQSSVTCGAEQCQVDPVSLTDQSLNQYRVIVEAN